MAEVPVLFVSSLSNELWSHLGKSYITTRPYTSAMDSASAKGDVASPRQVDTKSTALCQLPDIAKLLASVFPLRQNVKSSVLIFIKVTWFNVAGWDGLGTIVKHIHNNSQGAQPHLIVLKHKYAVLKRGYPANSGNTTTSRCIASEMAMHLSRLCGTRVDWWQAVCIQIPYLTPCCNTYNLSMMKTRRTVSSGNIGHSEASLDIRTSQFWWPLKLFGTMVSHEMMDKDEEIIDKIPTATGTEHANMGLSFILLCLSHPVVEVEQSGSLLTRASLFLIDSLCLRRMIEARNESSIHRRRSMFVVCPPVVLFTLFLLSGRFYSWRKQYRTFYATYFKRKCRLQTILDGSQRSDSFWRAADGLVLEKSPGAAVYVGKLLNAL
ncbi:hypothetical protein IW261DRAFT_1415311 [Armillaria novae-zelandiae]|uniref:Uncharacterized protein n=1 Tax=Armillaria novae-zelandiae TaxID=153914 RepID=A0AA39TGK7_9AGAR|nr:hypothetical protein IW261DRAFT_1415311 [Armillaria novae-zelandiae]